MKKEELAIISKRAKQVAIALCGWNEDDFDNVRISIDGDISVHFSRSLYGSPDYEIVYLSEEDMDLPIKQTLAKYKKIKQDLAKKRAKEEKEIEHKNKISREKAERTTYEKLKVKFEGKIVK